MSFVRVDALWVWNSPYLETLAKAVDIARAAQAPIVCDVDDLVFRPELARPEVVDALRTLKVAPDDLSRHYANVRRLLLEADHCTVPTAPLARELERLGIPTTVVPNGFDAEFLRAAEQARSDVVPMSSRLSGWATQRGRSRTNGISP